MEEGKSMYIDMEDIHDSLLSFKKLLYNIYCMVQILENK